MRKRSSYRPKGVRLDNMHWVMSGFKKLTDLPEQNVILRIKNHEALRSMVAGTGASADVHVLINALNMTEALAVVRDELGADWKAEIRAGQDALHTMALRGAAKGRFLFTGPELNAINQAMEIHDAQLDAATVAELERAMDVINRVLASGKAHRIEKAAHA